MVRLAVAMMLVLATLPARAQSVVPPTVSDAEKARLDKGEVVVRGYPPTDNKGIGAQALGVVDAPSVEVWPVLRDCQHFSKFMPRTKASAALEENGERLCHVELGLPFPLPNLWSDTRAVVLQEPAGSYSRTWTLVRGNYQRNSGSWTVVPWGPEGKKSLISYVIDSDPNIHLPDAILRSAQTGSLPEVFVAVRKRVAALRSEAGPVISPAPAVAPAPAPAVAPAPAPAAAPAPTPAPAPAPAPAAAPAP